MQLREIWRRALVSSQTTATFSPPHSHAAASAYAAAAAARDANGQRLHGRLQAGVPAPTPANQREPCDGT